VNKRAHLLSTLVMALLVLAEVLVWRFHLPRALLAFLAAAGFAGVVGAHMNLAREPRPLRLLVLIPLVFPLLLALAVVVDAMHTGPRP
jgi:hypothetical protein